MSRFSLFHDFPLPPQRGSLFEMTSKGMSSTISEREFAHFRIRGVILFCLTTKTAKTVQLPISETSMMEPETFCFFRCQRVCRRS